MRLVWERPGLRRIHTNKPFSELWSKHHKQFRIQTELTKSGHVRDWETHEYQDLQRTKGQVSRLAEEWLCGRSGTIWESNEDCRPAYMVESVHRWSRSGHGQREQRKRHRQRALINPYMVLKWDWRQTKAKKTEVAESSMLKLQLHFSLFVFFTFEIQWRIYCSCPSVSTLLYTSFWLSFSSCFCPVLTFPAFLITPHYFHLCLISFWFPLYTLPARGQFPHYFQAMFLPNVLPSLGNAFPVSLFPTSLPNPPGTLCNKLLFLINCFLVF